MSSPLEYMPPDYWAGRAGMKYYQAVRALLETLSPGESLLDVGGWDTPVATWGTFARRYTCDAGLDPKLPGVISHVGDFLNWEPPERMSVVTCLQVLEHLPDRTVQRFGAKLRQAGAVVIVSVPFCWPKGGEPSHLQDPIDARKLAGFMGGPPRKAEIIQDGRRQRIVGVWS